MVEMVNLMLCIFCHNRVKKEKLVSPQVEETASEGSPSSGPRAQKGPTHDLRLCGCCLEICNNFLARDLVFSILNWDLQIMLPLLAWGKDREAQAWGLGPRGWWKNTPVCGSGLLHPDGRE